MQKGLNRLLDARYANTNAEARQTTEKTISLIVGLFGILSLTGCIHQITTDHPITSIREQPPVESFVAGFKFPKPQAIEVLLDLQEDTIQIFQVNYGDPRDCPAGCFYSRATGMKHAHKIGWISVKDYEKLDVRSMPMYDIDMNDDVLFTDKFSDALQSKNDWLYRNAFLPMLAKDPDTPDETLLKIIQGLSTYIQPALGASLLENTKVQRNKDILTTLSALPVFLGDAYREVRSKAQKLLKDLE